MKTKIQKIVREKQRRKDCPERYATKEPDGKVHALNLKLPNQQLKH